MAKMTKKAQKELDDAIDSLGGGAPPVPTPKRRAAARKTTGKQTRRGKKR